MIYTDKHNNDFTWAILRQLSGELTRADVLGILETYKLNTTDNG